MHGKYVQTVSHIAPLHNMLRLIVLWSFFIFLVSAQVVVQTTTGSAQASISSSTTTSSLSSGILSSSASASSSSSTSTTPTSTTPTTPTTTLGQGPVGQPASTTGPIGGPTPFIYTTVADGLTQVVTGTFTPTNPTTSLVTPTVTGTIFDYSSWIAIYGPTQTSSTSAGYPSSSIPFTLILIMLLGILGGGGVLYV